VIARLRCAHSAITVFAVKEYVPLHLFFSLGASLDCKGGRERSYRRAAEKETVTRAVKTQWRVGGGDERENVARVKLTLAWVLYRTKRPLS
jgi:hypothetical protein